MKKVISSRSFLFAMAALFMGVFITVFQACKSDEAQLSNPLPETDTNVLRYTGMIKEAQSAGHSVFFKTENGDWVENPSAEWLTDYVKKQYQISQASQTDPTTAEDRNCGCDTYTLELQVLSGSFASFDAYLGNFLAWQGSGCFTAGNTYVAGSTVNCTCCPGLKTFFTGGTECNTTGSTKYILHRITPADCACYDYERTVVTPGSFKVSSYCCTINSCW